MATITSIGIGNMGAALASALLKSVGLRQLTIWNRTADRPQVKSLVEQGAHFEPSVAAAVARSDTILICLLDYQTVTAVFEAISPGGLAGKTVINVTNGTPRQAREAEARFKGLGAAAAYFDGGIMVTPQQIGTPEAFVILSGEDESAFRAAGGPAELLEPIGAIQYVASDAGAAALYDLAALAAMFGMFAGAFTGIALLKKQKRQRQDGGKEEGDRDNKALAKPATDSVIVPVLNALVPYVGMIADEVDRENWMNDMGNPLKMQAIALHNILRACEEEGVDGEGLKFISRRMDRAVADGFGPGGVSAIARYMFK
ncbi:hypothetical protein MYCTH_53033 [Thermothelomyces thermophilus ATCC 42464]|uniref:Uncharacterized protein n=1 Tax=Thermothelomyces thermophilus (strain ATCC 42464 / BCRC 31852 / DSM 1799) TaxID=573729 RepID=G2QG78_THET4|nr:uncharacterized protein MYCTH_53033 [Thermothelomyces thermophilus ATCC 42464]AEO59338.1 hypothetical protein MYCTH_53033 [Thermothelomyces thermophilus ATCC 42464]